MNSNNHKYAIEERRRQVASLLTKCKTQTEIGRILGWDQTTISKDIAVLRELSRDFVYSLARGDLGFCYKQCLDGIDEVKKEAWVIAEQYGQTFSSGMKYKLKALDIIIQAEQAKFKLLTEGPNVLAVNKMSERLENIEQSFQEANR